MSHEYLSAWPPGGAPSPRSGRSWPKITIVTPNFNEETTLERTILSIAGQGYPNLEHIVIDDGSSDGSMDILDRHRAALSRCYTRENRGQYATVNEGFSHATGEIFGWLNSDDIHLPWTLHTVADIFVNFPDVEWIMGLPATIQQGVVHRVRSCRGYSRDYLRLGLFGEPPLGVVQQESCFWRRSLWEKSGPLDQRYPRAADFELWTRFARHAPLVCCDTLLTGFTRTGKNRSIVHGTAYLAEVRQIRDRITIDTFPDERVRQQKLIKRLAAYRCHSGRRILRDLALIVLGLHRVTGPTLRRNFETGQLALTEEPAL